MLLPIPTILLIMLILSKNSSAPLRLCARQCLLPLSTNAFRVFISLFLSPSWLNTIHAKHDNQRRDPDQ